MRKIILAAALLIFVLAGCTKQTEEVGLESIAAYPETMKLEIGADDVIQVVLTPSNADATTLLWTSSDKSVATVDRRGRVSALSEGTSTITVASKEYSNISCYVEVIVGKEAVQKETENTKKPAVKEQDLTDAECYVAYVEETNAGSVYPTYYLSEGEVSSMDGEELQFTINQIYAKNGYVFRTEEIQHYFSQMPWYLPVSNEISHLRLSSVDQSNLNLLTRYRDGRSMDGVSSVGWIWTRHEVDSALSSDYISKLSSYDIQLLINTIYAKNGYIFETDYLQRMFEGQPWYSPRTENAGDLTFSNLDKENLALLKKYR